jgi:hypothetical protein
MALDFPSSPTNGQAYNGYVYSTAIGAWQAKPSAQSPFYTGDTPPGNPVVGDSWFNTNDGTMYVYFNDGNTSQWVEHRSEIARSQVGLVPIVPTSIALGSGTGSVGANGLVTFNAATAITLNGVFTNAYTNYKIIFTVESRSASATANLRMTTAGTQTTGSLWYYGGSYWGANGSGFGTFVNASADFLALTVVSGYNNTRSRAEFTLSLKDQKGPLMEVISNDGPNGSGGKIYGGRWNDIGTNYDGFRINYSSGNITGTFQVYGYNQ